MAHVQDRRRSVWRRAFPFLDWAAGYPARHLKPDLLAGITVAVVLVPQGMAYALLAGLPAIYGLYASLVPLVIYAFFGSSRQLSVGPVAITSILILTGVGMLAEPGSPEFIGLAISAALLVG
ncbi:MAG: SulP family inorganic anion transporter, partial [Saprospiraceae bacterium]|nr:SulP family inorganic anion transporter [Saprospiraceae bacterium]